VSTYRTYARPAAGRPNRAAEVESRRSNAAIPVAIAVVAFGVYLGKYSVLLTVFLGVVLLCSGGSFLSTRVNPLSSHFYLAKKPSWAAIGVVFLGALALFGVAYAMWAHGPGVVFPGL
jgi:Ca2+/Na+ antiporter